MELDRRRRVVVFVVVQLALPGVLLGYRLVDDGWWPTRELPMSWQMYSSADPDVCDETELC